MKKIKVLYFTHETKNACGSTFSLYDMLHSIREYVDPLVLAPQNGGAIDYLRSKGIKCVIIPFKTNIASRKKRWLKYVPRSILHSVINTLAVYKISKLVKSNDINLIHTNTSVITIGLKVARRNNLRHVWHLREFQNLDFGITPMYGWKDLMTQIKSSDKIIAITSSIAKHFHVYGYKNCEIMGDAVCMNYDAEGNFAKDNYLLFCGNVSQKKGAMLALKIFKRIMDIHPNFKLVYVGRYQKEYKERLDIAIRQMKIEDKVVFYGFQQEVKPFFERAKCFLMCSENEAQGRVTIEAMFCRCPIIGRNTAGTANLIMDGTNGFLYDTIEEAASKFDILVRNKQLYSRIAAQALSYAIENHSEECYGNKIYSIYRELLEQNE